MSDNRAQFLGKVFDSFEGRPWIQTCHQQPEVSAKFITNCKEPPEKSRRPLPGSTRL